MNRKLSILAAGLALSTVMTGCTSTAGYRTVTPNTRTTPGIMGRDYEVNRRTVTDENRTTRRGTTGSYDRGTGAMDGNRAGTGSGYIGTDGRWHPYAGGRVGVPYDTGTPIAGYPFV